MIPAQNIAAWSNVVPWADRRQVNKTSSLAVLW